MKLHASIRQVVHAAAVIARVSFLAAAALFVAVAPAAAASVTVAWDANTEPDLAGYRVHWGTASGVYGQEADAGMSTTWTVNGLDPGVTYYIAATARDAQGNESGFSNEVVHTVPGVPDMALTGNGLAIVDGDTTPSAADHTDFGEVVLTSGSASRLFTVGNSGSAALALTGSPRVSVSGPQAAEFAVTAQPAATVAPGGTTTFQVTFTPGAEGVRTAVVSIASDDPDENPYTFAVQGTGLRPAETVAAPAAPSGPASVEAARTATWTVSGSSSSWDDPVQYQIEWGDGTGTGWLPAGTLSASKAWPAAGTYAVRAKARCATDTDVESAWSAVLTVTVTPDKTPPAVPKALRVVSSLP